MKFKNQFRLNLQRVPFSIVLLFFTLCFVESPNLIYADEIAVVLNSSNPVTKLTQREISDIFLARRKVFPLSGAAPFVLEQPRNSLLRKNFFRLLNGMEIRQVNSYWARLQFSGEVQPPKVLPNSQAVIEFVRNNPDAIGYVEAASIDGVEGKVRAIFYLKD